VHNLFSILLLLSSALADFPLTADRLTFKNNDLFFSGTSTYLEKELYVIDEERWQMNVPLEILESKEFSVNTSIRAGYVGSGFMDGAIRDWHDFFSLPDGGRGNEQKGRNEIRGIRTDGVPFGFKDSGAFLGPHFLFVNLASLSLGLSIPISTNSYSPSSPDLGFGLREKFGPLSGGLAVKYFTDTIVGGVLFKDFHLEGDLSWKFKLDEKLGGAIGGTIDTPPYRAMGCVPTLICYLNMELNYNLESGNVFLNVRENPGSGEMTSDVSFVFGYRVS
jgi:hypothetical protein